MFEINFDLGNINFKSWHNWFHTVASITLAFTSVIFGLSNSPTETFWQVMIIGILWEIGDGFKPWYYDFKYNEHKSYVANMLRENLLYSDKFSCQDIIIWNFLGTLMGATTANTIF